MKRIAILFACLAILCLSTCENEQLITLLKAPSELKSLEIVAYAGDAQLEGGAAMEPGFTTSVFNYTVCVSKDTDRFLVSASIDGNGTIEVMCEENQETGTEFDFLDDEKVMILTVEREYMDVAEYRVTVIREETVPTARGVEISVTPGIAAFFLGRGVLPEFRVTAKPPSVGGVLSYQWYVNTEDSNRGGTRINGATGTTYKMKSYETMITGTFYYYAEITNTLDGKTGITESSPCRVTFVDKNDLTDKSRAQDYMINIPAGTVNYSTDEQNNWWFAQEPYPNPSLPWSTPGFSMGKYLVTWELWETIFRYAEAGNYTFGNPGNQGAEGGSSVYDGGTKLAPLPVGNALHPVTMINWRDTVVWCNALSEMDGREPMYKDSDGNVLRNSRSTVELLIDETKMTGNGYRLPTGEEWQYAGRGANQNASEWSYRYPGTNGNPDDGDLDNIIRDEYIWGGNSSTGEVGSRNPNSIGLYDMMGMVYQWTWWDNDPTEIISSLGVAFSILGSSYQTESWNGWYHRIGRRLPASTGAGSNLIRWGYSNFVHVGLRLAWNKE